MRQKLDCPTAVSYVCKGFTTLNYNYLTVVSLFDDRLQQLNCLTKVALIDNSSCVQQQLHCLKKKKKKKEKKEKKQEREREKERE